MDEQAGAAAPERKRQTVEEKRAKAREGDRRRRDAEKARKAAEAAVVAAEAAKDEYAGKDPPTDEPLWRLMERLLGQHERDDAGHRERRFREMLKRDPKTFVAQMRSFKAEADAEERGRPAAGGQPMTASVERLRGMARKLIEELTGASDGQ